MDAILLVDKPAGITSFDVIRKLRRPLKGFKVGHAGTLDPFATGLLVLLLGKATKLSDLVMGGVKEYEATLELGVSTDTLDKTGLIIDKKNVPELSLEQIENALFSVKGIFWQTPPMFSAKKVNGTKLYELARKNISIDRKAAPVMIFDIKFLKRSANQITFRVACEKGTYIRSLAEVIANKLGTVGMLSELRRLRSGEYLVTDALPLECFEEKSLDWSEAGQQRYLRFGQKKQSISNDLQTYINGVNSY